MGEGVKIHFFGGVKNLGIISYRKYLIFDRYRREKKIFFGGEKGDK